MKKKYIVLIILVIIKYSISYSQTSANVHKDNTEDKYLYLVMAWSENSLLSYIELKNQSDTPYLSCLWRLENDSLVLIDTLNFNYSINTSMKNIEHFDKYKWILFCEKEKDLEQIYLEELERKEVYNLGQYFSILDYSDESKIVLRKLDALFYPEIGFGGIWGENYEIDNKLLIDICLTNNHIVVIDKFGDIKTYRLWEKLNCNTYAKMVSGDYRRFPAAGFPYGKDGRLKYPTVNIEFKDLPDAKFQVPVSKGDGTKYSGFRFYYNTKDSKYLIGKKERFKGRSDSLNMFYILDKVKEEWDTFYLPKGCDYFNVYEDRFLYGTKIRSWNLYDEKEYKEYKKQHPKKYSLKYGEYPYLHVIAGSFFIYDFLTRKYIEYKGWDRDTELIQIIDGWIYYRVYDELHKIKLDEEKIAIDYSTDKMLYKDKEIIPNVHQVFMAKKLPLTVEWVTPKLDTKKMTKLKWGDIKENLKKLKNKR